MIAICFASPDTASSVASAVAAHASWLGRPVEQRWHQLADGMVAFAAWDPAVADDVNHLLAVCERDDECRYHDRLGDAAARVKFHLLVDHARVEIEVDLGAPAQVFEAEMPNGGRLFSDDLRLFHRLLRPRLDESGIFALFKWGAVPAPLTIFGGVQRLVPGTALRFEARTGHRQPSHPWRTIADELARRTLPQTIEQADELLISAHDRALAAAPAASLVPFSAGTDSPFLAVRMAALGRADTKLVHMSFQDAPQETVAARAMAAHLDLPINIIDFDPAYAARTLEVAALTWPWPFGAGSTSAAQQVVDRGLALGGGALIDGSAAGTGDSRRGRWLEAERRPRRLRLAAAGLQRRLGLWTGAPGQLERWLRAAALTGGVPLPAAALVHNALDGVCYPVPTHAMEVVCEAIANQGNVLVGGATGPAGFLITITVHHSAARWVAKVVGPAWHNGRAVIVPGLSMGVIADKLLILPTEYAAKPKLIQKRELARRFPPELLNRPKHAFMAPQNALLRQAAVYEQARGATEDDGPLRAHLDPRRVRRLLDTLAAGKAIGDKQAGYLWTLAFTDRWLRDTGNAP